MSWRGLALGSVLACAACGGRSIDDGAYDSQASSGAGSDDATCNYNGVMVVSGTVISNPCACVCKGGQFECQTGCDNTTSSSGAGGASSTIGTPMAGATSVAGSATASGGSSMGSAGGSALACSAPLRAGGQFPLIDDMEDNDVFTSNLEGRVGVWFTYDDDTPGADVHPLTDAANFYMSLDVDPLSTGRYVAEFSGSGFTTWGAGMGLVLSNSCPYDASVYKGVRFYARADRAQIVYVLFPTAGTNLPSDGGSCQASPDRGCYDANQTQLVLDVQWQSFYVDFASLSQQGWGVPAPFDAHQLIGINFQVPASAGGFEVAIDDVSFY